ncbi:lipopolysaccharide assembly protein LapA domain-containing protein [Thiolapillus sp.]
MLKLIKFVLLLGAALLGAGFASINPDPVPVNFYFFAVTAPLGLLVLVMLGLGAVLGVFSSLLLMARVRRDNHRLRRQARLASEEVNNLRTIPVKDR